MTKLTQYQNDRVTEALCDVAKTTGSAFLSTVRKCLVDELLALNEATDLEPRMPETLGGIRLPASGDVPAQTFAEWDAARGADYQKNSYIGASASTEPNYVNAMGRPSEEV